MPVWGGSGYGNVSIYITGTVTDTVDLPASGNTIQDFYVVSNTGHGHIWNGSAWIDCGLIRGPAGATGAQGPAGDTGPEGPGGPAGNNGSNGASAYALAVAGGFSGTEAEWLASLVGPAGATGPEGPQGPKGDTGDAGPQGPAGADGTSITPKGTVPTPDDLPTSGMVDGDLWIMTSDGVTFSSGDGYIYGSGQWNYTGPIRGPKGDTGEPGAGGAAGTNGRTLLNGTVDPTTEGQDGDFYLRTDTSELFGPKAAGAWPAGVSLVGSQGPPGATGAAGADGANGKSILNGASDPTSQGVDGDFYINTTANTLFGPKTGGAWGSGISLVGPQGPAGADGADGADGATGPAGSQVVVSASISAGALNLDFGGKNDVMFTLALNAAITAGITFSNVPAGAVRFTIMAMSDGVNTFDVGQFPASVTLLAPPYTYTDGTMTIYWGDSANGGTDWYAGNNGPVGSGDGDVVGPASAVNGHAVVFDGTTGKLIKSSGAAPLALGSTSSTAATGDHIHALDALGAPSDNTDLNASTSAHGLLPKLPNIATQYLNGVGGWSTPAGSGGGSGEVEILALPLVGDGLTAVPLDLEMFGNSVQALV